MSAVSAASCPVIRPLQADDLDRLVAIESASYPFPWTLGIFRDCLKVGYACSGLCVGSDLVGYSVFNWGAGEAHLLNLCVHPDWQRQGFGRLLLDHSIRQARTLGCRVMFLEVRPSNSGAVRLYERRGFEEAGQRPDYYPAHEGREDALVLRLDLQA